MDKVNSPLEDLNPFFLTLFVARPLVPRQDWQSE